MELLHNSLDYARQGGWVMVPLGVCSLLMWVLIFERLYTFRSLQRQDITADVAIQVIQGKHVALYSKGLKTRLVKGFVEERTGIPRVDRDMLRQRVRRLRAHMDRFLAAIVVLASVAPILGLLGTVLGMIQTFNVISLFGTGNAKAMANGISVALITTEAGLIVAIPGLVLSGMLGRQARQLATRLEETAEVLDRVIRGSAHMGGRA